MTTETNETTTGTESLFDQLETVVAKARKDYDKLADRGVQSRSTDFRKKTQEMRELISKLRKEAVLLRVKAHEASKAKKAAKKKAAAATAS